MKEGRSKGWKEGRREEWKDGYGGKNGRGEEEKYRRMKRWMD